MLLKVLSGWFVCSIIVSLLWGFGAAALRRADAQRTVQRRNSRSGHPAAREKVVSGV